MKNVRLAIVLGSVAVIFTVLVSAPTFADTNVSGIIWTNTEWTVAGSPYVVTGDVTVASGAVLTIDAGVTVKMAAQKQFGVDGKLVAVGTSGSRITFTSNQATPAAGDWPGLWFAGGDSPPSQLAYVTVSYAGYSSGRGIAVYAGSPSFSHVTVSNIAGTGVYVQGGSPTITGSTITLCSGYGLDVRSGARLAAISTTTISNNGGYAVVTEPGAVLPSLAGVTMTGNGGGTKNVLAYRGGTIYGTQAWHGGAPWLVLTDTTIASGAVLTIDAGVTVKMAAQKQFGVDGKLVAVGTSGSRITFTSNQATPAAGDWPGLWFAGGDSPPSQLAYVTVSYAGYSSGRGIAVYAGSPSFSHVTVSNIAGTGVYVQGGSPTITGSTITLCSGYGVYVYNGSPTITGSTITQCSGNAVTVSGGSLTIVNSTITLCSGNGVSVSGSSLTMSFSTISSCSGAAISLSASPVVAVSNSCFTGNGSGMSNSNPSNLVDARLNYWNAVAGPGGSGGGPGQWVSTGVAFEPWLTQCPNVTHYFTSATVSPRTFNPAVGGSTTVSFATSQPGSSTASVLNSSEVVLRTFTGTGSTGSAIWDGKDAGGTLQPDGTYVYQVESVTGDQIQAAPVRGRIVLDTTITAGQFTASQDVLQFNGAAGGTVRYTSVVPISVAETLVIKNLQGQVARTLVPNLQRLPGTYVDVWNGRNDVGTLVPDGPYFYVATVNDGVNTFAWDLSTQYFGPDWHVQDNANLTFPPFDPFDNKPLLISYYLDSPGTTTIAPFNADTYAWLTIMNNKYQASGWHTFTWAGVDATGVYRANAFSKVAVYTCGVVFAKNAVVVYGTSPTLQHVAVNPPVFDPTSTTADVSFDLGTYQNQQANVTITFLNQSSTSTLRTITLPGQTPGHVTVPWDGRADNGMFVAPGFYTVTVTATDGIGNHVQGQILATVRP